MAGTAAAAPVGEALIFEEPPAIITASRHEQKAGEAPASVVVIDSRQIERQGYRTLAEALQVLPGFYFNYDRNYTYLGVRGFAPTGDYNSRVQIQINGHPLNDNVWDYAGAGEDLGIDMSIVDRIEVVYGPGSALYGSNALYATINLITKAPADLPRGELMLEGGSFGRTRADVRLAGSLAGWDVAASIGALDVNGDDLFFSDFDTPALNDGVGDGTDFEKSYRSYIRADRGAFSVQASTVYRPKGIPTGAFGTVFNDDATRTTDVRNFIGLKYRRQLSEGLNLQVSGSYDEYRYWATYRYDDGTGGTVDNIDRSTGRWVSQEAQLDYRPSDRQRWTFGQGFVRNFQADLENFDAEPFFSYADVSGSFSEYSFYAQHELSTAGGFHLTTGLRYDNQVNFGEALSPRLALVYRPGAAWGLKFLAGRAFRAPNSYELFYEGFGQISAPDLDPETLTSYEIAFDARPWSRLDVRLMAYRAQIDDLITLTEVSPGLFQFVNVEEAETNGAEVEFHTRFANGLSGSLSYAYMSAEDGAGEHLPNYPARAMKARVSMPFGKERWRLSANMQYYAERLTVSGEQSPDVFLTNVTLLAPLFHRNARLSAGIYNLFDRDYGLPAGEEHAPLDLIPQDGRTFSLRLLWGF